MSLADMPRNAFDRIDQTPDADFYAAPRLVTHIDERAIAALTEFYRKELPPGGVLLDLMSSWVSHLPPEIEFAGVIGHGMNEAELAANLRLTRWWTGDLNRDPRLPLDDASLDAATLCVSVQYLQRPVDMLTELHRTLRPGAPVLISFSNRCFPTKAVAIWRALDADGHAQLVSLYLREAGFHAVEVAPLVPAGGGDPLTVVVGRR